MKSVTLMLPALALLLLSSCSTYQYVSLAPADDTQDPEARPTLKDSLEFSYAFVGDGGQIQIEIHNRSEQPVLLDKTKSALVKDNETIPFFTNISTISSVSRSHESYVDNRVHYTSTEGEIQSDASILFIPPDSKVQITGPLLENSSFKFDEAKEVETVNIRTENGYYRTKSVTFSEEETPATYRMFLTIAPYGKDVAPIFINQQFRVETLTNTTLTPGYFEQDGKTKFFIKEATGFGTFMGGVIAVGILEVLAASGGM